MLWKCLGEKHVLPNLTDLDELKLNKVNQSKERNSHSNFSFLD
jgi:hypothetical protein